jgi:hypothetical protein
MRTRMAAEKDAPKRSMKRTLTRCPPTSIEKNRHNDCQSIRSMQYDCGDESTVKAENRSNRSKRNWTIVERAEMTELARLDARANTTKPSNELR